MPPIYYGSAPFVLKRGSQALNLYYGSTLISGGVTYPPKDFYFSDFSTETNGAQLRALPGWSSINNLGAAQTGTQWAVNATTLRYGAAGDAGTTPGSFIVYRDTGSEDHIIRFKISKMPDAGRVLPVVVCSTHNQNSIILNLVTANGTSFGNFNVDKNVGNTVTAITGLGGQSIVIGDTVEIRVIGRRVYAFKNNAPIVTEAGWDIDTGGVFTKGTRCGFGTRSAPDVGVDDVYIAALAGNVRVDATQAFWPGSTALGGRSISLTGTYSGTVPALQYRVLNSSSFAEVQAWASVASPVISGGVWSCNCFVPMSSIATNPEYVVEVRAANDTDSVARTNAFAVGLAISQYGQSNANNRDGFGAFGATTAYSLTNSSYTISPRSGGWTKRTGSVTSAAAVLPDKLATITGIPVGHVVIGWGGQMIDRIMAESVPQNLADSDYFDDTIYYFDLYKISGYVKAWNWTQGEAEANETVHVDETVYRGKFDAALSKLRALAGADVPVTVAIVGKSTLPNALSSWGKMRSALFNLKDKPGVSVAHNFVDTPMADDYHYTANGYKEVNRRTAMSIAKALGYAVDDGRGPIITSATRSGATITLGVNLNGATGISGTGLNYYEVSTDNFATTKTISSITTSAGNIVITLSADPGAVVKVRSFYSNDYGNGANPAPVLAIGAYADGTTIPVEPLFVPVTSN